MTDNGQVVDPMLEKAVAALIAKRENLVGKHPYFKTLIYGDSGFGKTVFGMQLAQAITPPDKTIEFIDFLEGWVSLLNHPGLTARTSRQQYEGISQIEYLAKAIKAKIPPFDTVGTVILDELSAMAKSDLDVVLKSRAAKDASKDPNAPTQPDFYAATERMRRTVTELLQAQINVIVIAHIREDKLSNGLVVTRPAFMPAFSDIFRQMMHQVTFLSAEEFTAEDGSVEYRRAFQVHPTRSISAKTRVGDLPTALKGNDLIVAIQEWMRGERASEQLSVVTEEARIIEAETGIEMTGENLKVLPDTHTESVDTDEVAVHLD